MGLQIKILSEILLTSLINCNGIGKLRKSVSINKHTILIIDLKIKYINKIYKKTPEVWNEFNNAWKHVNG